MRLEHRDRPPLDKTDILFAMLRSFSSRAPLVLLGSFSSRAPLAVMLLALAGCGSSVDLCGGGAVCGVDGRSYTDRCAAEHAQVAVAYLGACAVECPVITCEVACPFGFLRNAQGCEVCECAECARPSDCDVAGEACEAGRCTTPGTDAGVDASMPDAGPTDAGGLDPDGGSCPDALDLCGDRCFDLATSDAHCGECFELCANGTDNPGRGMCVEGECDAVDCPDGTASCDGEGTNGCEVNLRVDLDHCGECGNSCGGDELCVAGVCESATEACSNPDQWTVTEERSNYCRAVCGDNVVELEGLLGTCGLFSTTCNLLNGLGTCEDRVVRCCYDEGG